MGNSEVAGGVTKALRGLKVVDFGWYLASPLIAKELADHGADVVRIESSRVPDILRTIKPFKDGIRGIDRGTRFALVNTGKYSMALNLADRRGQELARKLVSWADVVLEGYTPGTMKKWNLGYDDLKKIKPSIIMASVSGMGQNGPLSSLSVVGHNMVSFAGYSHLTGWPDRPGVGPSGPITDVMVPAVGVIAVLAALDRRNRSGKGTYIDISHYEVAISFLKVAMFDYIANGREEARQGNRSSRAAPHAVYRCKGQDKWCAIAVHTDREWDSFVQVTGNPPWTRDQRFATFLGRLQNVEELDALVEEWTSKYTAEYVMKTMQSSGVAAGVVESPADITENDPQLKYRNAFVSVPHREMGSYRSMTSPGKLSKTPARYRAAPCLGEHTHYVCEKILGMSDDEFAELVAAGVLE